MEPHSHLQVASAEFLGCSIAAGRVSARLPRHRGTGAFRWWPLSAPVPSAPRARALFDRLGEMFLGDEADDPWVTADRIFLRDYLREAEAAGIPGITCHLTVASAPRGGDCAWLVRLASDATWLGIDVAYCSGSFSFIEASYYEELPDLHRFLNANLNEFGLFPSQQEAKAFIEIYAASLDAGSQLETLDGAVLIPLWEDRDARHLRRLL
ncbi:MAG: hypothetical protein HYZ29_12975 [Myxococcales bacterium]|nr:hypothetical protein [Myxococcales bacterium]